VGYAAESIYEWGGGRDAFERWLNRFYDLVEAESPSIAAMFGGKVSQEHRLHVTDWWCEVMGGPDVYTEERGGYERMVAMHNSQPGVAVAAHAPVPRWGWGVAPPYVPDDAPSE